ncbi:hypothetical protein LF1_00520 [Rubripirellula obstinata]|uniref:Uncharacterized protein n=1 Tax=Rubripirellula obstinata TaxID=406547 RepID=A0A5B1CC22_9BACT|nr:hypothetical protein LF1_00520 [Rubripirellula obstinata]
MQRGKVAWIRVAQLSVEAEKQASGESSRRDLRASKGSSVEAEFGPGAAEIESASDQHEQRRSDQASDPT